MKLVKKSTKNAGENNFLASSRLNNPECYKY